MKGTYTVYENGKGELLGKHELLDENRLLAFVRNGAHAVQTALAHGHPSVVMVGPLNVLHRVAATIPRMDARTIPHL